MNLDRVKEIRNKCVGGVPMGKTREEILGEMITFIRDNEVDNYADFIDYCLKNNKREWFNRATRYNFNVISVCIDSIYKKHSRL